MLEIHPSRPSAYLSHRFNFVSLLVVSLLAFGVLGACAQHDNGELQWARAALERNPQIKVLDVDAAKHTIRVRVKSSGETLTLAPGELAAIPIGDLVSLPSAPAPLAAAPPAEAASIAETVPSAPESPAPIVEAQKSEAAKPEYKIEHEDGRVRVTGPGVSIETQKPSAPERNAAAQRFDEPIVCDGRRMLRLDNRRINVDGDAIVARGGCELYITNSSVTATGTAVTVLDATMHIANSEIQGSEGSLTASSAAHVFLRSGKFVGLSRRDPQAIIQDQGGNTWR